MAFREAMAKLKAKSSGILKSCFAPQDDSFEDPAGGRTIGPIQHLGLQHDTLGFQQDAINALGIQNETEERTVRMSGVTLIEDQTVVAEGVEDQTNIAEGMICSATPCVHHRNRTATELPDPSLRNSFLGWDSSSSDCAVDDLGEEADEEVVAANPQEAQAVLTTSHAARPTVATTSDNRPIFVSSPTREECVTLTPAELDEATQSDYHVFLLRNHRHIRVYQAGLGDDVADFQSIHESIHESINESIHEAASIHGMFPIIVPPAPAALTTAPTNNAAAPMVPAVTTAAPAMPSRTPPAIPAGPVVAPTVNETNSAIPVFFGAAPVAFTSGPVIEPVGPAIAAAAPIVDVVDAPMVPAATSEAPATTPGAPSTATEGAPAAAVAPASLAQELADSTDEVDRPLSKAKAVQAHHEWLGGKGLKDSKWAR
ncbi:hypothetical protein W97_01932 [Coniosporium apollinis CBS 100218]|uniref:Uncharacterized protein n=1 Tax=Coniosporium apollinis (strain CBS 100218) TaxID=1168221 RepID=R7YLF7_CONA1|nr:uncharacterized protein W97_01932 [Coniosporium apollinis CBS 100218]EON62708.1 hypothetical protein W97_01932 [Coniosporium apollinis CBS 100218]